MFRHIVLACILLYSDYAHAQTLSDIEKQSIIDFARDVSSDNATVMQKVAAIFENLSRDEETVGFYVIGHESDLNVAFRTTMTILLAEGYIYTYENKYLVEMVHVLSRSDKVRDRSLLTESAQRFIDDLWMRDGENFKEMNKYAVDYFEQLELALNKNGLYYLQIDFHSNHGNTEFIIPTSESVFEKWKNVEFEDELTVNEIQWVWIWDTIARYTFEEESELEWIRPSSRPLPAKREEKPNHQQSGAIFAGATF